MNRLLFLFLSLSLSGSVLALIFWGAKPLLKNRLSHTWQYYLWLLVLLRFLLPFAPEGNLINTVVQTFRQPSGGVVTVDAAPGAGEILPPAPTTLQPPAVITPEAPPLPVGDSEKPASKIPWGELLEDAWLLWLAVALVLLVHKVASYRSFVRFVKVGAEKVTDPQLLDIYRQALAQENVPRPPPLLVNEQISSPMLVGILRPIILLPPLEVSQEEYHSIFRHELTHYKRRDFLYKWLVQLTVCLHWFNPLIYKISKEIGRSCELSCDEAVIRRLDQDSRIAYGDALLSSLRTQGGYSDFVVSITMSENATLVKERLEAIMSYRNRRWGPALAVLLGVLLFIGGYALGGYSPPHPQQAPIPTEAVVGLLQKAEAIYQLGNWDILTAAQQEVMFLDGANILYYDEISNYEAAVRTVFTENSIHILETSSNLGTIPIIKRQNGTLYRASNMADSASTYYFRTIRAVDLIRQDGNRYLYEVSHVEEPLVPDYRSIGEAPTMKSFITVVDENGAYLLDGFVYPQPHAVPSDNSYHLEDTKEHLITAAAPIISQYFEGQKDTRHPAMERILSYQIDRISPIAGTEAEFCVAAYFSFTQQGNYPDTNGTQQDNGDGTFTHTDCYREFRIKRNTPETPYYIIGVGTGGVGAGLSPIYYAPEETPSESSVPSGEGLPVMSASHREAYERYLHPIMVTGVLRQSWSPEDISNLVAHGSDSLLNLFAALEPSVAATSGGALPADAVNAALAAKFPLSGEKVREVCADCYDTATNTYQYGGGLGGGPAVPIVTGLQQNGTLLTISYTWYVGDPAGDDFRYLASDSGQLMVQLDGDSFSYRSNRVLLP